MGSYAFNKGRSKKITFVMLRHDMMDSPTWRSLPPNARCVWCEIMRRYNGINNGNISLSCREASELCNISKNTAARAFKDLQEKGFIKIALFAGFKNKHRTANRWIITHEQLGNKPPTNEWKNP